MPVECESGLEEELGEEQGHDCVAESVEGVLRRQEVVAHHVVHVDRQEIVGQVVDQVASDRPRSGIEHDARRNARYE